MHALTAASHRNSCLTMLSLDADGRVVELTTFVLPELFAAWGFPPVLEAASLAAT